MNFELCADVGGTFTDVYIRTGEGETRSVKAPTTPDDLTEGLFDAFEKAGAEFDRSVQELLGETERLIHGTTVATNAIIEDETATTALLTTDGFRDVLTLREGGKEDPYDWDMDYPEPYVPRSLTYGVTERITAEGEIETELDEQECRRVIREIRDRGVDAIAVSLLWSHQNATHEERIGELIEAEAADLDYSLSSRVAPIIREYRRASATAINASLYGVVDDYLSEFEATLRERGFTGTPFIITANGGLMQVDEVVRTPIWIVDAGPTMFPVASQSITDAELGKDDVIALDMGGTSLDMGVVTDGSISRSREATVEGDHMLGIEKVDIKSIGSGGGSIAWVDDGGLLHVGPQSAGADPGPACYMEGGQEPTVTDAAMVLGYLNEEYFLGGEMEVSREVARDVIEEKIGSKLGLDPVEAAHAIYVAANQNMINGVKSVTIERGIDPQRFVLSGGGGALGTHAVEIARELQVGEILLPRRASVISAVGGLTSDIRRDFSESHLTTAAEFDHEGVESVMSSLKREAEAFFDRAEIPAENRRLEFIAEARYPSQVWELEVPLSSPRIGPDSAADLADQFHRAHEETYGFKIEQQDVEFLQWRVEAIGETGGMDRDSSGVPTETADVTSRGEREAFFGDGFYTCSIRRARELGLAFVEAETTTLVLPPESELTVTESGNYHIEP